jgi:hypothetical protein
MRAVIVYESMFGATRQVAEAIGEGFGGPEVARIVPVQEATRDLIDAADLLVVGGPTHVHGMTRPRTRDAAAAMADKPEKDLTLEPGATGLGLREWFEQLPEVYLPPAAAFDTRLSGLSFFTGRASRRISRLLKHHGARLIDHPRSFLVAHDALAPGQLEAARSWGHDLAMAIAKERAAA